MQQLKPQANRQHLVHVVSQSVGEWVVLGLLFFWGVGVVEWFCQTPADMA